MTIKKKQIFFHVSIVFFYVFLRKIGLSLTIIFVRIFFQKNNLSLTIRVEKFSKSTLVGL